MLRIDGAGVGGTRKEAETPQKKEFLAIIQASNSTGLDQDGYDGRGRNVRSGSMLEAEPSRFADRSDVGCNSKSRGKGDSKIWA